MNETGQFDHSLSPEEKRRLLTQLLQQEKIKQPEIYPLSFAQQRLWFFAQLKPESSFYHIPMAYCLSGFLSVMVLESSFNDIVRRQASLRTTFSTLEGEPVQIVAPSLQVNLPLIDLQSLSEPVQEAEIRRLAQQEIEQSFELARGPLIRVTLLRAAPQTHVILITLHHIIADGWSMDILFKELCTCYQAFYAEKASPFPLSVIQYADYAVWQHQRLQGEEYQNQLFYWKNHLANAPALLSLPLDHPRPTIPTFRGASQRFALTKELTQALHTLSQREGVTLFMTLLAAFQVLLARLTGQQDIVVGTPIANRQQPELEGLIGFFVNTLALRGDLSGNPTFQELLQRVRSMALEAYMHQDLPFEKIVEILHPTRDLSFNPLFQVLFTLQHSLPETVTLPALQVNTLFIENSTAKFDLELTLWEEVGRLAGTLGYTTDLFEKETIHRILERFRLLLEGLITHPEQPLSQLSLLTAERFIPHPSSPQPGQLLYRTGDRTHYLANGEIHFIGRADRQIKLRGFHTELDEIEEILRSYPAVSDTVVTTRENTIGETQIVAYVAEQEKGALTPEALRQMLQERLPDYMLPAFFIILQQLPRTPSGKPDYRSLLAPESQHTGQARTLIAPRTITEKLLSAIWSELLGIESIGVQNDFFEIGGHSLLALRLVTQIQAKLGQSLPLSAILLGRTIEAQASLLDEPFNNISPSPLVTIQEGDSRPPFFCMHPVGGNVLCYAGLAHALGPDQPFYALQSPGVFGTQQIPTTIEDMASHYLEAIRSVQSQGPYLLGGWSMGGTLAFEAARQLQETGQQVVLLALLDSWAPVSRNHFSATDIQMFLSFIKDLIGSAGRDLADFNELSFRHLQLDELLRQGFTWAQQVGILSSDITLAQMRQLFHIFQINTRAWLTYVPQPYSGRITLLRTVEQASEDTSDTIRGWSDLTGAEIEIQRFPGNHYTLVTHPEVLAARLQDCLSRTYQENRR